MKILLIQLFRQHKLAECMYISFFLIPLMFLIFANALAGENNSSQSSLRGLEIAQKHCSRCHVVSDNDRFSSIETTPSFFGLRAMKDWRERFNEFFVRPPHPALVNILDVTERSEKLTAFVSEIDLTLDQIEDLTSFEDIDVAFIGPNDLAMSLGHTGEVKHPEVREAIKKVVDVCRDRKIVTGAHYRDIEELLYWKKQGMTVLTYSTDIGLMSEASKTAIKTIKEKI